MIERLRIGVATVRDSMWLVPTLIVVACVAAAIALIEFGATLGDEALDSYPRLFGAGAEGARGMLATIAGSMITVAGVVFSITIVALSLTASQYSSRVLRNFMGDRRNQLFLGVFVGIFAYCLVVLRTIRSPDEGDFVPSLAVLGAVLLAFLGIAVLIAFIHHVANAIQASHILAAVHEDTHKAIDSLFPEPLGESDDDDHDEAAPPADDAPFDTIVAERSGYLQTVDGDGLMRMAVAHDATIRLEPAIGDFVVAGTPLMRVLTTRRLEDDARDALRRTMIVGRQRTLENDAAYGLRQIVDVALKALSPGINDVTTAVMCIDYLGALMLRLAARRFPSPRRLRDGVLRVVAPAPTFATLFGDVVDELRLAASDQPRVLARLVVLVSIVAQGARSRRRRAALVAAAEGLLASSLAIRDALARVRLVNEAEALIDSQRSGPEVAWSRPPADAASRALG